MIRDSECHILHSIFLKVFKWIWQRPNSGLARSNYFPSPKSRWWNNACTDNQLIPSHWSAWHLSARIICDVHQVLVSFKASQHSLLHRQIPESVNIPIAWSIRHQKLTSSIHSMFNWTKKMLVVVLHFIQTLFCSSPHLPAFTQCESVCL